MKNFNKVFLFFGIFFCATNLICMDEAILQQAPGQKLEQIKVQFDVFLQRITSIETSMNINEKRNFMWLNLFCKNILETGNIENLSNILEAFDILNMEAEIEACKYQADYLSLQKSKLNKFCAFCKRSKTLSEMKYWLSKNANNFYSKHIIEACKYVNLIEGYRSNHALTDASFVMRINELVDRLFELESSDKSQISNIELLIARLIQIKEQLVFDTNQETLKSNPNRLQMFLKFRTLFQNKKFVSLREDPRYINTADAFVTEIHQYFTTKKISDRNLVTLYQLEQSLSTLKDGVTPGVLPMLFGGCCCRGNKTEFVLLGEMHSIVSAVLTDSCSKSKGMVAGGLKLLEQLKDAGIDGSTIVDLAGAFLEGKKFKNLTGVLSYVVAKTGPAWLPMIVKYLPSDMQPVAKAFTSALFRAESASFDPDKIIQDPELAAALQSTAATN